jgi:hypothetical protein
MSHGDVDSFAEGGSMGGVFEVGAGAPNKLAASTAEGIEKLAASGGFSIITQAHETYSVREPPFPYKLGSL